jgi:hypothetical protein
MLYAAPIFSVQQRLACGLVPPTEDVMRAEIQNIVDEIKQSVVLLRRHL